MRKPFEHTLTPADRAFLSRCLLGISASYGLFALLLIGIAIANHHRADDNMNSDMAATSRARHSEFACPTREAGDPRCAAPIAEAHDDRKMTPQEIVVPLASRP